MATTYSPSTTGSSMERRRYIRFDTRTSGSKLSLIARSDSRLELRDFALLDISYGGMSFQGDGALQAGQILDFLIDLKVPLQDLVLVKARIEWTSDPVETETRSFGACFLDSSKGWLAGAEDTIH